MGITSLVLEKFGLITGAGLDETLLTMLARDGEVFFVLLRASLLVLPEERPGKSSAPPFITLCVSSLILPECQPVFVLLLNHQTHRIINSKDLAVGGGVKKKSIVSKLLAKCGPYKTWKKLLKGEE